jgi:6-phospho-3-hexuloisomerase
MLRRFEEAAEDLIRVLAGVKARDLEAFEESILSSQRVFVTGLGRTGLMMRGFAMRLMHLGRRVYHVGDVITPAIRKEDLLIIGSRTGRSPVLAFFIEIAHKSRAPVAVVTANGSSRVAKGADTVLRIDDRKVVENRKRRNEPYLPLGSLFEQALLLVLDQVVVDLMEDLDLTEADLARIHTRFE